MELNKLAERFAVLFDEHQHTKHGHPYYELNKARADFKTALAREFPDDQFWGDTTLRKVAEELR